MIYCVKMGNPIETDAVVNTDTVEQVSELEFLDKLGSFGCTMHSEKPDADGKPSVTIDFRMSDETFIFGLGESMRGMNKRGYKYISENTDEPIQTESKYSLYGAHNFIAIKDEEEFGLFIDYPGRVEFDLGFEVSSQIKISVHSKDLYIYLITGKDLKSITTQFRHIIGKSYIPPVWGFGYGQSRYGYKDENDVTEVVNKYRSAGIPLDMVYLDIDYMKDYKDFSIDEERFPNFEEFVEQMKEQGVRLIPIMDAAIAHDDTMKQFEEGRNKGYFCTNESSGIFEVGVWPGWTALPDFLRPEVRTWFGGLYKPFTDAGIEGFWNDMNEPAFFYTEKNYDTTLEQFENMLILLGNDRPTPKDLIEIAGSVKKWNKHDQYKHFYHLIEGKKVRHDKVHNLYGYNMLRATSEGLEEQLGGSRPMLFGRSSYIGAHRYAGIWTGDNCSWWSHLQLAIQQMPGLNMCGFMFSGVDTGGFGADVTEDLLLRWNEFSIFTPLFRNHSSCDVRRQECYRFENVKAFRELIVLRYRLIPYLYSEFLKCVRDDDCYFRALAFDFEEDDEAMYVDDQLLLGEGLMLAPVYKQNAAGRYVYLPEDMLLIRFTSSSDYKTEVMKQGHHFVKAALGEVIVFLRHGHILPLAYPQVCTADMRRYNEFGPKGELVANDFEIITWPLQEDQTVRYDEYNMACENARREIIISKLMPE
ncbi:MAG: alpha-glucosidase [Lachnospiraceae bacterium]|nr:alpha-glucosidase [Lachnospiraceae bacterium]